MFTISISLKLLTLMVCFIMLACIRNLNKVMESRKKRLMKGLTMLKQVTETESREEIKECIEYMYSYVKEWQ